jgi:hypothetical protein
MDTIDVPPDFREFFRLLNSARVRYLLIGGYAVNWYGYSRSTVDMDVWVAISKSNARRIVQALTEFGFGASGLSESLFLKEDQIVRMGVPPLRLEVLTSISGVTFARCFRRRKIVDIEGIKVNLISLRDLKINKRASGRPKDLLDLENLEKLP